MNWDDIFSPLLFKEGEELSYADNTGVYLHAEIVRAICPECGEEFIGNKANAGKFLLGHHHYHEYENQQANMYGGI